MTDALPIPASLNWLISMGAWPTTETALTQNGRPLVPSDVVERVAPGERSIYFEPPPFATLASEVEANPEFWAVHGALDEIEPERALILGDFGAGSDTVLVLDYRASDEPSVMRLHWDAEGARWVEVTPTFEAFAQLVGLA